MPRRADCFCCSRERAHSYDAAIESDARQVLIPQRSLIKLAEACKLNSQPAHQNAAGLFLLTSKA
jgi:hypothetical protein